MFGVGLGLELGRREPRSLGIEPIFIRWDSFGPDHGSNHTENFSLLHLVSPAPGHLYSAYMYSAYIYRARRLATTSSAGPAQAAIRLR